MWRNLHNLNIILLRIQSIPRAKIKQLFSVFYEQKSETDICVFSPKRVRRHPSRRTQCPLLNEYKAFHHHHQRHNAAQPTKLAEREASIYTRRRFVIGPVSRGQATTIAAHIHCVVVPLWLLFASGRVELALPFAGSQLRVVGRYVESVPPKTRVIARRTENERIKWSQ